MRISVIGTGYVGLITGVCFAELGHYVILVDIIPEKVEKINRGIAPIFEENLDEMLKKNIGRGRIHATTHVDKAIAGSGVTFISVGTPGKKDGSIDLACIRKAAEDIGKALKSKEGYHTVVMKSTVVPGTTEEVALPAIEKHSGKKAGKDFGMAVNPEFLREGLAVKDFMNPDRIVMGGMDVKSVHALEKLYRDFTCPKTKTDIKTAEMIKYASNAFLATKISFSNEIGNLCKKLGIDSYVVAEGMGHDARIGNRFLNSGIGYGGSCFPKDVKALTSESRKIGTRLKIIEAAEEVNDEQPLRIVAILKRHVPRLENKSIAVLGLAFKPGTDDIREAPSLKIVKELLHERARVKAYDPEAAENFRKVHKNVDYCLSAKDALKDADACLILTEWDEFRDLSDADFRSMRKKVIIEGRRVLDKGKVKGFEGVCW